MQVRERLKAVASEKQTNELERKQGTSQVAGEFVGQGDRVDGAVLRLWKETSQYPISKD